MADGKVTIDTRLNLKGIESGLKNVKGLLGGLAKTAGKVSLAIVGAFTTAAVALTKMSLDEYAKWQQLIGGVETLYGNSADKIKKYAEDAFFTAGMSANEYMETAIGVSASLISSLAGDTEKAADIANMAIIDMSDNANKMGSDIENVRAAYAGFAKQQYQLLDNLALGYQGTKTEMERLLKDAEAYSGVKYDINNLADVYSAIHAIQEKMGITGATAAEAEKTITGSANMTAAAWKNVLVAISGGGDFEKAINNLVYSISKYFDNIVPVVQRSLAGIGQLIEKIAPQLVQTVAASLIASIPSLLSAVYQMIMGLAKGIYQGIIALFTGGSFSATVEKQLNNVAAGYTGAASGAKELAKETEKAGKAAKKSLAGFDDLNILSGNSGGSGAADSAGTTSAAAVTPTVSVEEDVTETVSPVIQVLLEKIKQLFEPLKNIDFGPLIDSLALLKEAFDPFVKDLFEGLEWAWFNLLVPLAEWTIEDALPAFLDTLSACLGLLHTVIEGLKPFGEWLWNNFLAPLAQWTGGAVVTGLEGISTMLTAISEWIANNRVLIEDIAIVIGALATAIGLVYVAMNSAAIAAGILTAATTAWNAICAICTGVTSTLGMAISFLTSPVALVIAAITALIAIVALCIKHWDEIKLVALDCWEWIKGAWDEVARWFDTNVVQPIARFFSGLWTGISDTFSAVGDWFAEKFEAARGGIYAAWEGVKDFFGGIWDGIKEAFGAVGTWFEDTFSAAWSAVKDIFSTGGEIFDGIKEGISGVFTTVVNGIIKGINKIIATPFNKINSILNNIRGISIAGFEPFSGLWKRDPLPVPQIPLLAKGAVLPANKPFLAMLGDQKHGTNVEAPLATIQEAVATVMQDYVASNLAGHEAVVAVLQEILEAIWGIQIGDEVIAAAVERYRSKMAVVKGG